MLPFDVLLITSVRVASWHSPLCGRIALHVDHPGGWSVVYLPSGHTHLRTMFGVMGTIRAGCLGYVIDEIDQFGKIV